MDLATKQQLVLTSTPIAPNGMEILAKLVRRVVISTILDYVLSSMLTAKYLNKIFAYLVMMAIHFKITHA